MEVLRGRGQIADLDIVLGAGLQESFEARAGMLGALAFVAVWQKQDDAAGPLPFRFRRDDKLIDDGLRAISEIAELRFPQAQHFWVIERVTVVEPKNGGLGKRLL